jgi:hypothetical protein
VPWRLSETVEKRHLVVVIPQSVAVSVLLVAFQICAFSVRVEALRTVVPVTVPGDPPVRVRTAMYQLAPSLKRAVTLKPVTCQVVIEVVLPVVVAVKTLEQPVPVAPPPSGMTSETVVATLRRWASPLVIVAVLEPGVADAGFPSRARHAKAVARATTLRRKFLFMG